MSAFSTLQRLAQKPPPGDRCDMCGVPLGPNHRHLVDPTTHRMMCACAACSLLFPGQGPTRFKSVPRDARLLKDFKISDGDWENLNIPIGLAFFLKNSVENRVVAFYPSPAGATESSLPANVVPDEVSADVEALLVNRLKQPGQYYVAPIDKCYELVGLIRGNWRGFTGGPEVWEKVDRFFECLT
ncbi:MAG: DUF5947 family protein [Bryobacteraceae bacterium]